jgi:very-short-patch-repair endonuclease
MAYQRNYRHKLRSEYKWPTQDEYEHLYITNGYGLVKIAKMYNIPYASLNAYVHEHGWKLRDFSASKHKTITKDQVLTKDNLELWYTKQNMSTQEIAENTKCTRDDVVRRLRKHGIPIRHCAYVTWSHKLLVNTLRKAGIDIQDWQINYRASPTRYMIDIAFPESMLGVEIDGRSHFEDDDGYYGDRIQYDMVRDLNLVHLGWDIRRYTDHDIRYRLHNVVDDIKQLLGRNSHECEAPQMSTTEVVR